MKAALVSPSKRSIEIIEVAPDVAAWKTVIGADMIDHQTLWTSPSLLAVVDDSGVARGLPTFTIYAKALHARIALAGDALVIGSNESQYIDVTDADIERLDIDF